MVAKKMRVLSLQPVRMVFFWLKYTSRMMVVGSPFWGDGGGGGTIGGGGGAGTVTFCAFMQFNLTLLLWCSSWAGYNTQVLHLENPGVRPWH
jgi:hypothetical protein